MIGSNVLTRRHGGWLAAALAAALIGMLLVAAPADAKANKIDVCHTTGNGSYHLISVTSNAYQSHIDHGDEAGDFGCDSKGGGGDGTGGVNTAPFFVDCFFSEIGIGFGDGQPSGDLNDCFDDAEGDSLTFELVEALDHPFATLTLDENGTFFFDGLCDDPNSVEFVVRAFDGTLYSAQASIYAECIV